MPTKPEDQDPDEQGNPPEGGDGKPPVPRGRGTRAAAQEVDAGSSAFMDGLPRETDITKFHNKVTRATKEKLAKAPRTTFQIYLTPKENPKSLETVSINGYVMAIPKGKLVSVPLPVARILAESYQVQIEAGREMLADRSERKDGTNVASALSE